MIENGADWVCAWALLSFTEAVKVNNPEVEGVPEISPDVAAKVSPDGRRPELRDQV